MGTYSGIRIGMNGSAESWRLQIEKYRPRLSLRKNWNAGLSLKTISYNMLAMSVLLYAAQFPSSTELVRRRQWALLQAGIGWPRHSLNTVLLCRVKVLGFLYKRWSLSDRMLQLNIVWLGALVRPKGSLSYTM
eukprot:9246551-Pyramimonas_sp.AAC.1